MGDNIYKYFLKVSFGGFTHLRGELDMVDTYRKVCLTVIVACVGLLIFSEAKADYQAPLKQEIKTTFCKNIEGQTTMLMNTYNSNEISVDGGNEEVRNEIVRIRSIGLTNLNFMANIWVAFCNK